MWLQTKGSPYPTDRRVRIASFRCHRTDRPMRGIFWRRTQRALDHSGNLIIIDRARPARASFIQEPFDAILQKPSTPFADFVAAYNFARRLKTLKGLTPFEFVSKCWTSESDR